MTKDVFEKFVRKYVETTLKNLPRTRNGDGWFIAYNRLELVAAAITNKILNFKEMKERLSAKERELVQILIDAEKRYPSKQDVLDALLNALDD